jgi:hypothetical protein
MRGTTATQSSSRSKYSCHNGATRLHNLELVSCLEVEDVAFLIRWLARLPSLTRLILYDDAIGVAAELPSSAEETNIFRVSSRCWGCHRRLALLFLDGARSILFVRGPLASHNSTDIGLTTV